MKITVRELRKLINESPNENSAALRREIEALSDEISGRWGTLQNRLRAFYHPYASNGARWVDQSVSDVLKHLDGLSRDLDR